MTKLNDVDSQTLAITLDDGKAYQMGDGIVIVDQQDPTVHNLHHRAQRAVLTQSDLEAMQGSYGPTLHLEDGQAEYVGDGIWIVVQHDETVGRLQNVVLNDNDRAALLIAA